MSTTDHTSDPMGDALRRTDFYDRGAAERRALAAEVASRGYRERAERERDAALRTMDEHRCDGQAERAYKRAIHAEAERDALAERAEAAEAKAARFAGLLGHQSRTLTDAIAAEVLRQKADAWDTRDEIRDAVERYGRECQNAVESFRCAEPDLDAVMALIEPHLAIAEAARKWVASRPKGGVAAVAIGGTVHTVATYEQVKAEAALRAAVDAEQVGGEW